MLIFKFVCNGRIVFHRFYSEIIFITFLVEIRNERGYVLTKSNNRVEGFDVACYIIRNGKITLKFKFK